MHRKISETAATAFVRGFNFSSKNTTVRVENSAGAEWYCASVRLRLHGSVIAERAIFSHDFKVSLAGYNTATTRERINTLLERHRSDLRIRSRGGLPYVMRRHGAEEYVDGRIGCDELQPVEL
jgi:hypothetical protein